MEEKNNNPLAKRGPGRPRKESVFTPTSDPVGAKLADGAEVKDTDSVTLTGAELKALREFLAKGQVASNEARQEQMLDGLATKLGDVLSGRHRSPAQKENEEIQRRQSQHQELKKKLMETANQMNCDHLAGGLGETKSEKVGIWWWEIHHGIWVGVCPTCGRQFWPVDPDYRHWFTRPRFNRQSARTGERFSVDGNEWLAKEHSVPFGSGSQAELKVPETSNPKIWHTQTTR